MTDIDLKQFIPIRYRDDEDRINNVLSLCVNLFQDILNGKVYNKVNFNEKLDSIKYYWDCLKTKYVNKLRRLIDPLNVSRILALDQKIYNEEMIREGYSQKYIGELKYPPIKLPSDYFESEEDNTYHPLTPERATVVIKDGSTLIAYADYSGKLVSVNDALDLTKENYFDYNLGKYEFYLNPSYSPSNPLVCTYYSDEQLGRLLYFISSLNSFKGTMNAFRFIIRLVGMDVRIIRWYDAEWSDYVFETLPNKNCKAVLVLYIGNHPLTEDSAKEVEDLCKMLLDITLTFVKFIVVKNLEDKVNLEDWVNKVTNDSSLIDLFNHHFNFLSSEYGYPRYDNGDQYRLYFKYERCLSVHDLTRYRCNACSYIYDPVIGEKLGNINPRTPYYELPVHWVCPSCHGSRTNFTKIEFDPRSSVSLLQFINTSLLNRTKVNDLVSLVQTADYSGLGSSFRNFFDAVNNCISDGFWNEIIGSTLYDPLLVDYKYLLKKLVDDKYHPLDDIIPINKEILTPYSRSAVISPYHMHTYPHPPIGKIINHKITPQCTYYHNGFLTYDLPFTNDLSIPITFVRHIVDPVLRYGGCPNANHFFIQRNRYYDLDYNPLVSCNNRGTICPTTCTTYPYPRHSGSKTAEYETHSFYYGIVQATYYPELITLARRISDSDITPLSYKVNSILSRLDIYSGRTRSLFIAMDYILSLLQDSKYELNIREAAESNLSSNDYLKFISVIDYLKSLNEDYKPIANKLEFLTYYLVDLDLVNNLTLYTKYICQRFFIIPQAYSMNSFTLSPPCEDEVLSMRESLLRFTDDIHSTILHDYKIPHQFEHHYPGFVDQVVSSIIKESITEVFVPAEDVSISSSVEQLSDTCRRFNFHNNILLHNSNNLNHNESTELAEDYQLSVSHINNLHQFIIPSDVNQYGEGSTYYVVTDHRSGNPIDDQGGWNYIQTIVSGGGLGTPIVYEYRTAFYNHGGFPPNNKVWLYDNVARDQTVKRGYPNYYRLPTTNYLESYFDIPITNEVLQNISIMPPDMFNNAGVIQFLDEFSLSDIFTITEV